MATLEQLELTLNDIIAETRRVSDKVDRIPARSINAPGGLSDITNFLGTVTAGEFRTGNGSDPGKGFSGVRIAYPGMTYSSTVWNVAGVSNDVLQFGLRASDGKAVFGAGTVVLDSTGLLITSTTDRIHLQADGDAFFGTNIAAAATTALSIFSNAQTYNTESMGAGDVLFGDNSSGKANILWDASAGQLLFRGGTTTQGYIDTDGSVIFGAGDVELDANGLMFQCGSGTTSVIKWRNGGSGQPWQGQIWDYITGTTPNRSNLMMIKSYAEDGGTGTATILIGAEDGTTAQDSVDIATSVYIYGEPPNSVNGVVSISHHTDRTTGTAGFFSRSLTSGAAVSDGFGMWDGTILDTSSSAAWASFVYTTWTTADYDTRTSKVQFVTVSNAAYIYPLTLGGVEVVVNEGGDNLDFRVEGDTATSLLLCDAGLEAVQIGTTVAGAIADFRAATIVFNEASNDVDFRVESNGNGNAIFVDGGNDRVGIFTGAPTVPLDVTGESLFTGTMTVNGAAVFNESSADVDFRVESNGNANMLFIDAGNDRVGIGTGSPSTILHVYSSLTPTLTLEGAGQNGAILDFNSNSNDDLYNLGVLNFKGLNSADEATTYGTIQVQISDATNGTEDCNMFFESMSGGTLKFPLTIYGGVVTIGNGEVPESGFELTVHDDIYAHGNVSALTFTDRTPFPKSLKDAYDAVLSVRGTNGKVDHDGLHESIKSSKAGGGRNLSALVSAQAEVIKDLIARVDALEGGVE